MKRIFGPIRQADIFTIGRKSAIAAGEMSASLTGMCDGFRTGSGLQITLQPRRDGKCSSLRLRDGIGPFLEPGDIAAVWRWIVVIENQPAAPDGLRFNFRIGVFVEFGMAVCKREGFDAVVITGRIILDD